MLKLLAVTLSLAVATTAAIAALPPKNSEIASALTSNEAVKGDRLDRTSAKSDRLAVPGLDASVLIAGPALMASAR